jgi:hypothetical protein
MEMVAGGDWQHAAVAGDFGADWPDFNWTAQVSDFSSTTLKSVDVTVSWRHRNKDRSVTLTTLVYAGAAQ